MLMKLFQAVQQGMLSADEAASKLRWQPVEAIGSFAEVDHHRELRQGMPEFVYAQGKTPEQTAEILAAIVNHSGRGLASRASEAHFEAVLRHLPTALFQPTARLITVGTAEQNDCGHAIVVAAGTSDAPVAEEAAGVLRFLGNRTS